MFLVFRKNLNVNQPVVLNPDELKHARARRLQIGEEIFVGDGIETRYAGSFIENRVEKLRKVESYFEPQRDLHVAIPKQNRWDLLVEKTTEIGVTRIQPVLFEYSVKTNISIDRSNRLALQAASQSRRFRLPDIKEPIRFQDSLNFDEYDHVVILHPDGSDAVAISSRFDRCKRVAFFIGPEGGFSSTEFDYFESQMNESKEKVVIVSTGRTILRTETAAIAAISIFTPGQC